MGVLRIGAFVPLSLGLVLMPVSAIASDCNDAVESYNSAISDIETYMKRYVNCVSGSRGQDDCSSEFRRLRNVQDDFESAVSNYRSDCD
jgi:hypothetical protein